MEEWRDEDNEAELLSLDGRVKREIIEEFLMPFGTIFIDII